MKKRLIDISNIRGFLISSFLLILCAAYFVLTTDKTITHLAINDHHNGFFDVFFTYMTYLGDGIVAPIIVLILGIISFKKYRFSSFTIGFGTLITAGILSQGLKRLFFEDVLRPSAYIGADNLYLVPGVEIHTAHSFPSGHTTAAFALAAFIAFMYFQKSKAIQFGIIIIAALIGFSRIYLSQHFLEDVTAGAGLGVISFLLVAMFVSKRKAA